MTKDQGRSGTQIHSLPSQQASHTRLQHANKPAGMTRASKLGTHRLPSQEEIGRRAYELFLRRGSDHGHDLDDWLQAEAELRSTRQLKAEHSNSR